MNADIKGNLLGFPVFFFFLSYYYDGGFVLNMAKFQIITSVWPFYGHLTFSLSEITEVIGKGRELRVCFRLQTGQMLVSALYLAQNALFSLHSPHGLFTCMQPNPVKHVWFIRLRQQTVTKKDQTLLTDICKLTCRYRVCLQRLEEWNTTVLQ